MYLGILNDTRTGVIHFQQIKYSEAYDSVQPYECCIVIVKEEENKTHITPLQTVAMRDQEGKAIILGEQPTDMILEVANEVFENIDSIVGTIH